MTRSRRHGGGIYKDCDCSRDKWTKCPHSWYLNFYWQGTYHRFSLDKECNKHLDTKDARTQADRIRDEIRNGTFVRRGSRPTASALPPSPAEPAVLRLRQLCTTYCDDMRLRRLKSAEDEADRLTRALDTVFVRIDGTSVALGDLPANDVQRGDIRAWMQARRGAQKRKHCRCGREAWATCKHTWHEHLAGGDVSVNRMLVRLRAAFNWAVCEEYVNRTPFKREGATTIRLLKEQARHRRLQDGEEERLLAAASPHLQALIIAGLETGCRKSELLSLQWGAVRMDANELCLQAEDTKANRVRVLPISRRLKALLEMRRLNPRGKEHKATAYVFGTDTGERIKSVNTAWRAACRRASITGLNFQDLRREAGSRLLESGFFPLAAVRDWLDHSNISVTSRYLQAQSGALHKAMRQFDEARNPQKPASDSETSVTTVPATDDDKASPAETVN